MSTEKLLDAVREGRPAEVPALLAPLDGAERRACLPALRRIRAAERPRPWRSGPLAAAYVAGAGCHTGAAGAAQWLLGREFARLGDDRTSEVLEAFAGHDPRWLGEVAQRLAARPSRVEELYPLVAALVRTSGGPVPVTDGFVRGWIEHTSGVHHRERATLTERLREDPFLHPLVPRLFEAEDTGGPLDRCGWAEALLALTAEGVLDRAALVDATVARLLRGDRPGGQRFFRRLLAGLALSEDESAARARDWVRLAADASSAVAGDAQAELRRLWDAGRLDPSLLAEASRGVLFRTERKLVRAQLVLLGRALARDRPLARETAAMLLPAAAEAFGHPDAEVQERALKLVARHLAAVGEEVRAGLAENAALLGPALRRRAAAVFGESVGDPAEDDPYTERLPPVPAPRRFDPPPDSAGRLAEEIAALLRSPRSDPLRTDWALDGLVRHAHRDRAALAEALRPVWERTGWRPEWPLHHEPLGIAVPVLALLGLVLPDGLRRRPRRGTVRRLDTAAQNARLRETALTLCADPPPFLLATPSWESGRLEPRELIERLRVYARTGIRAGRADLEQALLRVRQDRGLVAAAAAVGTPDGERLAAWLASGGLHTPRAELLETPARAVDRQTYPYHPSRPRRLLAGQDGVPVLRKQFSGPFARLGDPYGPDDAPRHGQRADDWLAVLPWHRETAAVRVLPGIAACADSDARGAARELPALAEAGGEAGPALHLALGYGLGARDAEDRTGAVDALLVLAARGELDAEWLGGFLATLVAYGSVKPNRLADALDAAAATGAYGTVWRVLRPLLAGLLPGLLAGGGSDAGRGPGALLETAAGCVERCGEGGEVPGLATVAARRGTSRLIRQAKRLRDALAAPPAAAG